MITKEINLGKVAPVGKREYSTETSYDVLDIVSYHGQSYMSLHADNVGNDPSADSDETHWMLLAERGESWYQMCVRTGRFTGTEEEFLNEKQKQIDDATAAAKTANKSSEEALKQASNAKVQADRARDIAIITEELYALVERENNTWMAKEQARENAELARANAEKLRAQAEQSRVKAEEHREQKRIECEQATKNANDASNSANSAASYAKEVGDHQPIIGEDGYWYRWDADNDAYEKTDQYAHGSPLYPTPSIKNNKLIMTDNGSNLSQRISLVSNKLIFKF